MPSRKAIFMQLMFSPGKIQSLQHILFAQALTILQYLQSYNSQIEAAKRNNIKILQKIIQKIQNSEMKFNLMLHDI